MRKVMTILLILGVLVVIGAIVFRFAFLPSIQKGKIVGVSETARIKYTGRVAGDNYLGYWFINSREFKFRLGQKGYTIAWFNDNGNYADRLQKFEDGNYDIIVLPVNSYIQHGKPDYPGVIVAALSDSKGADNILGYEDKLTGGQQRSVTVNDLNNPDLRIGATPDSPSSFLLDTAIVSFDLDQLKAKNPRYIETNGSEDACLMLAEKDPQKRQLDAAVLWEPDVSQCLQIPGVVSIFGSDQISGMIIDVFVAGNKLLMEKPEFVEAFFEAYFETLNYYGQNIDEMTKEMAKTSAFKTETAVKKALDRIAWFDLQENYNEWFGIGNNQEKIIRTIIQVTEVMIKTNELQTDPLQGNPYRIKSNKVLEKIYGRVAPEAAPFGAINPVPTAFSLLSETDWSQLRRIGAKVLPITFDASTLRLTLDGSQVVDQAATLLIYNFPQYRVIVKGHTAPSGDEAANMALSQERAELVRNYLMQVRGIDANRIKAIGVGSREPLPRDKQEPERSYRNRLARVELIIVENKR